MKQLYSDGCIPGMFYVLYMLAVVIDAVFPTTEADHDFATEELGEDQ